MERNGMSIGQLAALTGVTRRTIRYYLQRGLLPPPGGAGKNRIYGEDHRLRLLLIRRLQEAHYPLEEIRFRLAGLSLENIKEILSRQIDFMSPVEEMRLRLSDVDHFMAHAFKIAPAAEGAESIRATWVRMDIAPGVEIHYRAPVSHRVQEALDRLRTLGLEIIQEALDSENFPRR